MSNTRIISYFGDSTDGPTVGISVKDANTVPNIIQNTLTPTTVDGTKDRLQRYNFLMNASSKGTDPALEGDQYLSITVDLTLLTTRYYQFSAILTLVAQSPASVYHGAQYSITGAAKGNVMMGSGGYIVTALVQDDDTSSYIPAENITLTIVDSKFVITATAKIDIRLSLDMMADVTINSARYCGPT